MFKKHKTPSLAQARKMSKDGYNRRTKAVIDNCIDTIDRYIACSAANGDYHMCTWFHNNSGFLTPSVIAEIIELFKAEGYSVTAEQTEDREDYPENYYIRIDWDAAC